MSNGMRAAVRGTRALQVDKNGVVLEHLSVDGWYTLLQLLNRTGCNTELPPGGTGEKKSFNLKYMLLRVFVRHFASIEVPEKDQSGCFKTKPAVHEEAEHAVHTEKQQLAHNQLLRWWNAFKKHDKLDRFFKRLDKAFMELPPTYSSAMRAELTNEEADLHNKMHKWWRFFKDADVKRRKYALTEMKRCCNEGSATSMLSRLRQMLRGCRHAWV
eukprot:jgi/Ulvmu1/8139/UM040_0035.1